MPDATTRISAAMCAAGRTVGEPRLAPTGERIAFVTTSGGRGGLVVVDLDGGHEQVVTTDPAPQGARAYGGGTFDWLPDGSALVYAASDGGLWSQPAAGGPPRRLVAGTTGRCAAPVVSPDGTQVAYVVDQHDVAVAQTEPDGLWPVRISGAADFALDPAWSPDGTAVAWHEWSVPAMPWDASTVVVAPADGSGAPRVVAGGDGRSVGQPRFSTDGTSLGHLDDRNGFANLWASGLDGSEGRPLLEEAQEHAGPSWGHGQRSWAWSPDGRSVAVCRNVEGGFGDLVVVDLSTGEPSRVARGAHGGLSWVGDRLAAVRSGGRTPTQVVVYEGPGQAARRTIARGPVAGFESAALVEPEVVSWPGEDGGEVHGRLYAPAHADLGTPPPLICWVHGGPTDQWGVTWNPRIAFWVDAGWAVLVPDHRGSTGHGRAYTQAMAGRWGELDVADVAAGLRAAAERGWGDGRRLVVMGGSAGGFTVLNVLASHPELCAAGVDLYGVADLFELDETTHRYEAHYLHSLVGPLPEAADAYRERSPVNRIESITSPLLILQGSDDAVVPLAQSESVAHRLHTLGRTVELHVYDGEGHGWGRPETVVDELERATSFLRRHVLRWRAPA
ncbi:MAG: S9 family peptidase [Acidimicrobiales bacterium]